MMGVPATELGAKGTPRKPGTKPLRHSFAAWQLTFPDSTRLDEMLPALLAWLGGTERLCSVRQAVAPELLEFDISMWIKDSDEQEGGFLDASTIAALAQVGATLSIGLYARNDT